MKNRLREKKEKSVKIIESKANYPQYFSNEIYFLLISYWWLSFDRNTKSSHVDTELEILFGEIAL